jgi:hypothetical protein
MSKFISSIVLAMVTLVGLAATPKMADAGNRSSYSRPTFHKNFHYRQYSYFSNKHREFRQHYAFYFNNRPKHVYFYNPHKNQWWGRYDLTTGGYSLLKEEDRNAELKDIPEAAFPKPGKMPAEEQGGAMMDIPPAFAKE